jgi:hypothetical protein
VKKCVAPKSKLRHFELVLKVCPKWGKTGSFT